MLTMQLIRYCLEKSRKLSLWSLAKIYMFSIYP